MNGWPPERPRELETEPEEGPILPHKAGTCITWYVVLLVLGVALGFALGFLSRPAFASSAESSTPATAPDSRSVRTDDSGSAGVGEMFGLDGSAVRATENARGASASVGNTPEAAPSRVQEPPPASAFPREDPAAVLEMIRTAALRYGLSPEWFTALIKCESSFRTDARGAAGEIGLAQWIPSTWESNRGRLGYSSADLYDPARNVELAAFVISQDGAGRWTCGR